MRSFLERYAALRRADGCLCLCLSTLVLRLAHAEDESADVLEQCQQDADPCAFAESFRKLDALHKPENEVSDAAGPGKQDRPVGLSAELCDHTACDRQKQGENADPALPAEVIFLIGAQKRDQTVPARFPGLAKETPSADY